MVGSTRPAAGQGGRADDDDRAPGGEDRAPGGGTPFGPAAAEAMSRRVSPSTGKVHGLQRVTRLWGVPRATVHRHRCPAKVVERQRPGPRGAVPDEGLVAAIRQL